MHRPDGAVILHNALPREGECDPGVARSKAETPQARSSRPPLPRRWRRRVARWVLLPSAAVLLGWLAKVQLFPTPAAKLITVPAVIGNIEESVVATGTLKPVKLIAVGAQVSGRITALKAAVGQKVRAGDLIAEIDALTKENDLRSAQATLDNVRAQRDEKVATLAKNEASLARQKLTFAQNASSRADYDSAEADVKATQAQIAQLDAQITEAEVSMSTARVNLGYTRITAPIGATVLAVGVQEGQTVNATQSAPTIVVLGDLDTMTIRAQISEADVVKVRPGQQVYFTILGEPERRLHAILRSIEPAPESVKTDSSFSTDSTSTSSSSSSSTSSEAIYYNGVFDVPNVDGHLRTYMTAEVHVLLREARNVLTIPAAALSGPEADGSFDVRVVNTDSAVARRSVKVGLDNKIAAEIREGLSPGERVVIGETDITPSTTMAAPPPGGM
ncbi:efflux RND transporter periplasmic adaptor subunit [Labrys sp. KNU-23]|uniref:efflux RND transporter periplasmic adaptor subunit n=1 Tax=Labrys sp. KNU-23 TaxID=2789216 RepID=UPI0011EE0553|nr:efflux RND transporter periplasmic adaptor subunit [Labrys sp. KNU-23]QEN85657.1 efflux RND transporter periplasmic adaptor subunit [Labrys sp. KNU-23]